MQNNLFHFDLMILLAFVAILSFTSCDRIKEKIECEKFQNKKYVWITEKISGELNLTEQQRTELNEIRKTFFEKIKSLQNIKKEVLSDIQTALKKEEFSKQEFEKSIELKSMLIVEIQKSLTGKIGVFIKNLSSNQKKLLLEKITEHLDQN